MFNTSACDGHVVTPIPCDKEEVLLCYGRLSREHHDLVEAIESIMLDDISIGSVHFKVWGCDLHLVGYDLRGNPSACIIIEAVLINH